MKTRVITGLALAAAVGAALLWTPAWAFAALAFAVAVGALVEWNRLGPGGGAGPVAVTAAALAMAGAAALLFASPQQLATVCVAGALLWAWLAWDLFGPAGARHGGLSRHPRSPHLRHPRSPLSGGGGGALGNLAQGAAVLWVAWCALVWLRVEHGAATAAGALAVVAGADCGAYFIGKRFGRRRLAPAISPGKTVAGVVGGVGAAVAGAGALAWAAGLPAAQIGWWACAALVAAAFSVLGDLHESRLKRRAGVKDSGGILPGHGGLLDRIDGLIAALPPFAVVWQLAAPSA